MGRRTIRSASGGPAIGGALLPACTAFALAACASTVPSTQAVPCRQPRFVILTADDYGASPNIDEGIEFALSRASITAVSALMNFPSSYAGLRALADRYPSAGIGVHFNLTTGSPLLDPRRVPNLVDREGNLLAVDVLLSRIRTVSPAELELELRAQARALEELGIRIDHLSDHNGVLSLYPPFFEVFCRLAGELGVPVRTPLTASVAYPRLFPDAGTVRKGKEIARHVAARNLFGALGLLPYANLASLEDRAAQLDELGIPHPDILIDYLYGSPSPTTAMHVLRNLPDGISEIVVHLGTSRRSDSYPPGLDVAYFPLREQELALVTSGYLGEYAASLGIRAIGFAEAARMLARKASP
jgi:predicted glycoside hydrolase/deacetylase ChbG (UPF0249 family)